MKEFTINEIREFDIVTLRSGVKTLVIRDCMGYLRLFGTHGHCLTLSNYEDSSNLGWFLGMEDEDDIMEVRRPSVTISKSKRYWNNYSIIWKREPEVKEMTVAEISEALGYTVKVVE